MKNSIKLFALSFAAIFGFAACQQNITPEKEQPAGLHTVKFTAELASTKTSVDISDGTTAKYSWSETDAVAEKFHIRENGSEATYLSATLIDGLMYIEATFGGATVENAEYKAYFNSGVRKIQNGNATMYDRNSDVLVATAAKNDGSSLMLSFERRVAFARITLKGLSKGATVGKVVVEAVDGKTLAADYDYESGLSVNPSSKITIENAATVINGGEAVIWLVSVPFDNAGLKIAAETLDDEGKLAASYEKELSRPLTLSCNDVTGIAVSMEELPEAIETSTLYMIGMCTKGAWDTDAMTPMIQDESDPYIFTFEGTLMEGDLKLYTISGSGCYALPAIRPGTADAEIGENDITDAPFVYQLEPDNKWKVKAGKYRLTFNLRTYRMSSTYLGAAEYEWPDVTPVAAENLYLLGDAPLSSWDVEGNPVACDRTGDYIFEYKGWLNTGRMRASTFKGWGTHIRPKTDNLAIGVEGCSSDEFVYVSSPDFNWNITSAGNYHITFDLENWKITVKYLENTALDPIQTEKLYLIGSATTAIWNIENAVELTRQGDYIFVYEGYLAEGLLRACTERSYGVAHIRPTVNELEVGKSGCPSNDFVCVTSPDFNWKVVDAGNYRLTFDLEHWTVAFDYLGEN